MLVYLIFGRVFAPVMLIVILAGKRWFYATWCCSTAAQEPQGMARLAGGFRVSFYNRMFSNI
jgi:hypothetical protein